VETVLKVLTMSPLDNIEVETNGKIIQDWCHVFINGTGFLNNWKCERFEEMSRNDG
jgi:hypothetical protein